MEGGYHRTARGRSASTALLALLALLCAGCGPTARGGTSSAPATGTATATSTPTPTATPTPIALPTVTADQVGSTCPDAGYHLPSAQVGDLYVGVDLSNTSYPDRKLPDGIPDQPYVVSRPGGVPQPTGEAAPPVNPGLGAGGGGGLMVVICNASASAPHRVDLAAARVAGFRPYVGVLNAKPFCDFGYSPVGPSGGGCGGAFITDEWTRADFAPSAGAGATAPVSFVDTGAPAAGHGYPPLPVTLPPHRGIVIGLGLTPPAAAGYYRFAIGVVADGGTPAFVPLGQDLLLDKDAREWTGGQCQAPQMRAQIPADSTASYVCPPTQN